MSKYQRISNYKLSSIIQNYLQIKLRSSTQPCLIKSNLWILSMMRIWERLKVILFIWNTTLRIIRTITIILWVLKILWIIIKWVTEWNKLKSKFKLSCFLRKYKNCVTKILQLRNMLSMISYNSFKTLISIWMRLMLKC
jgi:hypothetical protein